MITSDRKLSRKKDNRQLLLRNLMTSLVLNGKVVTTEAKAKALRPLAERTLLQASSEKLADRRRASNVVLTKEAIHKLLDLKTVGTSGQVKLVRTTPRSGDNAPQVAVILNLKPVETKPATEKKKSKPQTS